MIIKKIVYHCTKCKYKTNIKLNKMIHEQNLGHKMVNGCCQRKQITRKISQQFDR